MALEFKVYQREDAGIFTELGTLKDLAGKGGKLGFIPANFNNPEKQVAIVIKRADGTSTTVACSKPLSAMLRNKEITLGEVALFNVTEAPNGSNFVGLPLAAGNGMIEFEIDKLKTKAYEPQTINHDELIVM